MKQRNLFTVFLWLLLCLSAKTKAQDLTNLFVTVWDTQYMSNGYSLFISCENNFAQYFWEKVGSENTINSGDFRTNSGSNYLSIPAITSNSGVYRVYIKGSFTRINMFDDISANSINALIAVESWGNMKWSSMNSAFRNCKNLRTLPAGAPDLSNVTDMSYMFTYASAFNSDISNWDVSKVTNMSSMFSNANVFNSDISNWDVAKVANMTGMFSGASSFNQDIGNWNVANVRSMGYMFSGAKVFNQDISNWNVRNVNGTQDMEGMFRGATAFNQNISTWNVAYVRNMLYMFYDASSFNQNLGAWQLSSSVNMDRMFEKSGLSSQNYGLALKGWAENNATPNARTLGAAGLKYPPQYQTYRDKLTNNILRDGKGWTINDAGVDNSLPVNLISFTAKAESSVAKLQWLTANESNNKGFEIYRSGDDGKFVKLGDVSGSNGSSYIYTDKQPLNGNNYYKLVQVDNDGTATELGVKVLNFGLPTLAIQLYPNPAHNRLSISVAQSQEIFKIYNAQGKIVVQQVFNQTQNSVDITSLPAGLYFYNYGSEQGKFVKQ